MTTISVGQAMEVIATQAADYAVSDRPDLDERTYALADYISASIDGPSLNGLRFFESLFERLDAATEAMEQASPGRRGRPEGEELESQKLFFAAMTHEFRNRFVAAAAA
ncbi:hypothetical protein [Chenggangzhangella methanolivorans]|uniref:Uncharacterized protein n=1 Tax=Chenggangzhangella methanolivorans TaxID=1437009 RepID=A0A9E6UGC9_9HYPH|nr:hypothetical protein [Chenggangzhangella methanolivorans]QZN98607.1 hypothetical protein K6K41_16400 [Chenggangzhangella methanolivorans]